MDFDTIGFDYSRHEKEINEDAIIEKYDYKTFEICGVTHHVIKVKFEKKVEKIVANANEIIKLIGSPLGNNEFNTVIGVIAENEKSDTYIITNENIDEYNTNFQIRTKKEFALELKNIVDELKRS